MGTNRTSLTARPRRAAAAEQRAPEVQELVGVLPSGIRIWRGVEPPPSTAASLLAAAWKACHNALLPCGSAVEKTVCTKRVTATGSEPC